MLKAYIGALHDGTKVYLVDGEEVRALVNVDFVGGGHGYAYPGNDPKGLVPNKAIPKDEIWLENGNPKSITPFFTHEVTEYLQMKYCKKAYLASHEMSNSCEAITRLLLNRGIDDLKADARALDRLRRIKK